MSAPCLGKFRGRAAFFALGGVGRGNARSRLRPCTRLPLTAHRADYGGISGKLLAVPVRQSIADHFDASGILDWHVKGHVCQPHVLCDPCASLFAHPGQTTLQRDGSRGKSPGCSACCPVVAQGFIISSCFAIFLQPFMVFIIFNHVHCFSWFSIFFS